MAANFTNKILRIPLSFSSPLYLFRRNIKPNYTTSRTHSDGAMPTTLSRVDVGDKAPLISAYSTQGFSLQGVKVMGSVALLPKGFFHWNVNSAEGITPESLILFTLAEPKLGVYIINISIYMYNVHYCIYKYCLHFNTLQNVYHMTLICLILELVVIGTGSKLVPMDTTIKRYLQEKGISVEVQDTVCE